MQEKIQQYIRENQLFSQKDVVIVGLSGGADSVVLLHLLHRLGYSCIAAHCNFHLRGEESVRDEIFSRRLAESLQVPFEKTDFDTHAYAATHKLSVEMAARELRYNWFETLRNQCQAGVVAVAHHKDDSVETILLNLIRGTGIHGLTGIQARSGNIVRPLLCVDKQEILSYTKNMQLEYVTDSTNLENEYTRNKIRLQVLPLLQTINPSVTNAIDRMRENLMQTRKIFDTSIEYGIKEVFDEKKQTIHIRKLLSFPSPEALLHAILSKYNFNTHVVRNILETLQGQSGKTFYSPAYRLVKDRQFLILRAKEEVEPEIRLKTEIIPYSSDYSFENNKQTAYFDKDKLQFPLYQRKWKAGDTFVPFGMTGKQKISKYFKDHTFNNIQKEAAWLLCSGEDIIWIIGERADNRYKVDRKTNYIYKVTVKWMQGAGPEYQT